MHNKIELSTDSHDDTKQKQNKEENIKNTTKQKELDKIFEERFDLFMNQLSKCVEEEHVPVAISIVVDPKYPATPMIFRTGHIYDQARLLANVLRVLKEEMNKELFA